MSKNKSNKHNLIYLAVFGLSNLGKECCKRADLEWEGLSIPRSGRVGVGGQALRLVRGMLLQVSSFVRKSSARALSSGLLGLLIFPAGL